MEGQSWQSARKLSQFLGELDRGGYTHVWILMDPDALNVHGFPAKFRQVCKERNVRSMIYFPVDAPLEAEWLSIVTACDVAATYTEYGRTEVRNALGMSRYPMGVIPHGMDEVFKPLTMERRAGYRNIELILPAPINERNKDGRKTEAKQFLKPDDFLILNVNKNEWRKDPLRSLEILKGLRAAGLPAKLILRMQPYSTMGGPALEIAALQMGLTYGKEWCHMGEMSDEDLCGLYNAADLYLTTSLGEGWGLGVTEAMACHTPVAMPCHTSLKEIGEQIATPIWLPLEEGGVCGADTRVRHRVDLKGAVEAILKNIEHPTSNIEHPMQARRQPHGELKRWSWDTVAEEMWGMLVKT